MRHGFLFGGLVAEGIGFAFALKVLPIIIFFASLIAVLYHRHHEMDHPNHCGALQSCLNFKG